jgi:hypothetical protein
MDQKRHPAMLGRIEVQESGRAKCDPFVRGLGFRRDIVGRKQ